MKIKQIICLFCNKDTEGFWTEQNIYEIRCPHCDTAGKPDDFVTKVYETEKYSNMDMYYVSCSTVKETLGRVADQNTKKMGSYVQELDATRGKERKEKIDQMGKNFARSGKRPFYRPDKDGPISESEAQKIIKEFDIGVKNKDLISPPKRESKKCKKKK